MMELEYAPTTTSTSTTTTTTTTTTTSPDHGYFNDYVELRKALKNTKNNLSIKLSNFRNGTESFGNVYAVNRKGVLGPICDIGWGDVDARVVCR